MSKADFLTASLLIFLLFGFRYVLKDKICFIIGASLYRIETGPGYFIFEVYYTANKILNSFNFV